MDVTNRRVGWWHHEDRDDNYVLRVRRMPCPLQLSFDNNSLTFDSSCRIFDQGGDRGFSFDSTDYKLSSDQAKWDAQIDA